MKRRPMLALLGAAPVLARAAREPLRVRVGDELRPVVAAARDGDVIELDEGLHRAQTALVTQAALTLRGRGAGAVLQADGAHVEGKALCVVRGGRVTMENLEFRGCRVPAGNGAGIRFERGQLVLRHCRFLDNEMGLLTANAPDLQLDLEACRFGQAPQHEGLLHHLLYVGTIGRVRVAGCHFDDGWRGHLVKSRAAVSHIIGNRLIDGTPDGAAERDGEASYELDLPNGGRAWVLGNLVTKGRRPQNDALVSFGAEGPAHGDSALVMAHNTLVHFGAAPATALRHWPERLPAGRVLVRRNNLLIGAFADASAGPADEGNVRRPLDALDMAAWPRAALRGGAEAWPAVPAAGSALGLPAEPEQAIDFPLGLRPLPRPARWRPGAFQE